jgi:hypothetical protein
MRVVASYTQHPEWHAGKRCSVSGTTRGCNTQQETLSVFEVHDAELVHQPCGLKKLMVTDDHGAMILGVSRDILTCLGMPFSDTCGPSVESSCLGSNAWPNRRTPAVTDPSNMSPPLFEAFESLMVKRKQCRNSVTRTHGYADER